MSKALRYSCIYNVRKNNNIINLLKITRTFNEQPKKDGGGRIKKNVHTIVQFFQQIFTLKKKKALGIPVTYFYYFKLNSNTCLNRKLSLNFQNQIKVRC